MNTAATVRVLVLGVAWAGALGGQTPTFPSQVKRVTVDVTVTDADGRPVTGLGAADFVIKDGGVSQAIVQFEAVDLAAAAAEAGDEPPQPERPAVVTNLEPAAPGRSFLVVWDDLNIAAASSSAGAAREALETFLRAQTRDGDRVTLAATGGGGFWSGELPRDRDDLLAAVQGLKGRRLPDLQRDRISDYEAMLVEQRRDEETILYLRQRFQAMGISDSQEAMIRDLSADIYRTAKERNERSLGVLERAMRALAVGRGARLSVLLISDGFIRDERLPGFRRVLETARQANAVLYFLDARGLRAAEVGGGAAMHSVPDTQNLVGYNASALEYAAAAADGSEGLAADTGGFTVRNTNDLSAALARISREGRSYYLLGFEPSDKRQDGKFRKLEVEVRRPGVKVSARKGYYAPGGKEPRTSPGQVDPELLSALDSPSARRDVPMRAAAYVLGAAAEGRVNVLLVAEADPEALALEDRDGLSKGALESFSSVVARDGQQAQRERLLELALTPPHRLQLASTWVPISHSYDLPPGSYQARFAVRDRKSRRLGSVGLSFRVPEPQVLRLTTPVLTDTLQRGSDGAAAPSPIPIARRSFALGSRLACSFGVEGVRQPSRVLVTYEVRRADGSVVTRTPPTPLKPDASGALASSFSLGANNPGRYEIRLHARDEASGEEAAAVEGFEVQAASAGSAAAPQ